MNKLKQAFAKLDRPPAAHNWVRYNHPDTMKTAKAIASFVMGFPPFTFIPGIAAVKDRIELGIDLETALRAVKNSSKPNEIIPNIEFVKAFFEYDTVRNYSGHKSYASCQELFRISPNVSIPVSPTAVIIENGRLVPVFACGWKSVPFTLFQRRLLMTIYEDAIFSLTDFQDASAEILFLPEDKAKKRYSEVWQRGDYPLLTDQELSKQVEIYFEAKEIARSIVEQKIRSQPDYEDYFTETGEGESEAPLLHLMANYESEE